MKAQKIILASHISDLSGPTEALEKYLVNNSKQLLSILNPLHYCQEKKRVIKSFANKNKKFERYPTDFRKVSVISWMLDIAVTFIESLKYGTSDLFLACDPLMGIVGVVLKKLGRVNYLILYSIDWTDQRFENRFLNKIYYTVDKVVSKNCDFLWCISDAIVDLRIGQDFSREISLLVPVGVYQEEIIHNKVFDKNSLVFLGAFEKTKGIELVIDAWDKILKLNPEARLVCIGKTPQGVVDTPYEEKLKTMRNVDLIGLLLHEEVLETLSSYGIGLAPYSKAFESISKYCDPSRVKDYIACGLPTVITDVPPIYNMVEKENCGVVFRKFEEDEFVDSIRQVWENYNVMRVNTAKIGKELDWNKIFESVLSHV